ncbi:hypothetical protein ACWDN8_24295, partial [Streptomyces rubiginosohelvolus]
VAHVVDLADAEAAGTLPTGVDVLVTGGGTPGLRPGPRSSNAGGGRMWARSSSAGRGWKWARSSSAGAREAARSCSAGGTEAARSSGAG